MASAMFSKLNSEEREVEFIVRGINPNSDDCLEILNKMLEGEEQDPRNKPGVSHAKKAELEIGACREMVEELKILCRAVNLESDNNVKESGLTKSIHWYERALRAKKSFGDVFQVTQISYSLRRCVKHFESLMNISGRGYEVNDDSGENVLSSDEADRTITKNINFSSPSQSPTVETSTVNSVSGAVPRMSRVNISSMPSQNFPGSSIPPWSLPSHINHNFMARPNFTVPETFGYPPMNNCNSYDFGFGPSQYNGHFSQNYGLVRPNIFPQHIYGNPRQPHNSSSFCVPSLSTPRVSHQLSGANQVNLNESINPTQNYSYKKSPNWKILFDGTVSPASLEVHDFVFRLETYAEQDGFPLERLPAIIQNFVGGNAEKWVWTYKRGHPNSTWVNFKEDLLNRFSSHESDRATRRMLERRLQKPRESFNDFVLEMEATNWRLVVPFEEAELLEIVRENMNSALQNVTVAHRIDSMEALRSLCLKFETLWSGGSRSGSSGDGYHRRLSEIQSLEQPTRNQVDPMIDERPLDFHGIAQNVEGGYKMPICTQTESRMSSSINLIQPSVSTVTNPAKQQDPTLKLICWNCRDIGHRYQECQLTLLHIFCFGCGLAGFIKPQCPQCISRGMGKAKPSGFNPREMHSAQQMNPGNTSKETVATNTEPV